MAAEVNLGEKTPPRVSEDVHLVYFEISTNGLNVGDVFRELISVIGRGGRTDTALVERDAPVAIGEQLRNRSEIVRTSGTAVEEKNHLSIAAEVTRRQTRTFTVDGEWNGFFSRGSS